MKAKQAWQAAKGQLQVEMPKAAFDTWVRNAELVSYEDGSFIIGVQNAYARDWLEGRLSSTVKRILTGVMNRTVEVRFVVWQDENTSCEVFDELSADENSENTTLATHNPSINPRYSFNNFIVGPSNRLAHAASLAVAEKPAQAYNPLFLYGGVGLGKTHLLHAIGNMCSGQGLNILYISSEEFTNDLVDAIRTHRTHIFREKYRHIDVLLIDDIQFIAGKESTQEEFFHTFNKLHGQNKQIVISSDRPPKALVTLQERLCSRFEWGLAADIQHPDFETRLAILRSKADRSNLNISNQVLENIANLVQSNIRELEGALTRVSAYATLNELPLSTEIVETSLADFFKRKSEVKPERILQAVADGFNVEVVELSSRNRSRRVALPRQVAMYLLREETGISLPRIGDILGGRDHTTVLYGYEKIADLLERDDRLRSQVIRIRETLYNTSQVNIQTNKY